MAQFTNSEEVRGHLVGALKADLVGPHDEAGDANECLEKSPLSWYLTGFLAPRGGQDVAPDDRDDDDDAAGIDTTAGAAATDDDPSAYETVEAGDAAPTGDEPNQDSPEVIVRRHYIASAGLTVLLPPDAREVTAVARWADYARITKSKEGWPTGYDTTKFLWRRQEPTEVTIAVPLDADKLAAGIALETRAAGERGLTLVGHLENAGHASLPPDTQVLSLFLVNQRTPASSKPLKATQFAFQVSLEVRCDAGMLPRPDVSGELAEDYDDRIADLQFRDRAEYAVGHNVATEVIRQGELVIGARTCFIPTAKVKKVITHEVDGVQTEMEQLAALDSGDAVRAALLPLINAYEEFIAGEAKKRTGLRALNPEGADRRQEVAQALIDDMEHAKGRLAKGIERIATDAQVREAFCLANHVMARQARQRNPKRYEQVAPAWRLFQLAFVLLNIESVADETHEDRDTVELIFFPTGGGKTEAYLGVIAFALIMRRFKGAKRDDKGLGVAVILRYTLRLLTLDQLSRAATLICALEILRQERLANGDTRLGETRFAIGVWVGRSATANTLRGVTEAISEWKNGRAGNPCPLTECPWCGSEITPGALTLQPNAKKPERVKVTCSDHSLECPFGEGEGIPLVFVDEQVYAELPCFIIATVDKFAMLPWRGQSGVLFGKVAARDGQRFFGHDAKPPAGATALPDGLHPPELIVQDELHLISGPLGSMVGLFESVIDALATRHLADGGKVRPKLIASTATVKRAREQIRALYARDSMQMFPPPGLDDSESFFAKVDHEAPGRLYVGVAASGRSHKGVLLRTYMTLLGAARKGFAASSDQEQPQDPYMTLVGYFNSLRELGGTRRLIEDEAKVRCRYIDKRRPVTATQNRWLASRQIRDDVVELTSREKTSTIADNKARLALPAGEKRAVDVALASNMISVGLDIDRLGLMVVNGQPKSTAEYIQATSRVGRRDSKPGLVVTVLNHYKPRDRSHYEHFVSYHESFYRHVEASSVTPFSDQALTRGLAAALVTLLRYGDARMTPPEAVTSILQHTGFASDMAAYLAERAIAAVPMTWTEADKEALANKIRKRALAVLDDWKLFVSTAADTGAGKRSYSPYDPGGGSPILQPALEEADNKFAAPTSMRDVEATVHVWVTGRGRYRRSSDESVS